MVSFITGPMNSGKTTRLKQVHSELGGDGFLMIKVMRQNKVHSYKARRLSSGEEGLLVIRDIWKDSTFQEACRIGPYCFSEEVLSWIEKTMYQLLDLDVEPLYLDEIGQLELEGKGFATILSRLIERDKRIYVTAREDLIPKLVACFSIDEWESVFE